LWRSGITYFISLNFSPESENMKKTDFEQIVTRAFRALESKHGFKRSETVYIKKGCSVQFLNPTTDVTLHYEIGAEPWLSIADVHDSENRTTLDWLLVERGVMKAPTPAQAFSTAAKPVSELPSMLEKKSQQLIEHGKDFIKGDFSLMPALQKRAKKHALDCDRYLAQHQPKK
jgi:hypothetical protein